ncbi:MAG: CaiB/BaiF CoA-transferase family protein [Oricola sp.]
MDVQVPLNGIRVVETSAGVAAAYAGRLLASMGADTVMVEPPALNPLRREPPFLGPGSRESALFGYLGAGKRSVICDLASKAGRAEFDRLVSQAHILIDDTPLDGREAAGLDRARIADRHPNLVHVSVLPFGASGPKAGWRGTELNLIHASSEGYLLPNGLSAAMFPDRPPLKIAGHFAEMQGGIAAALAALSALWAGEGQFVDISVQDANIAVGAFAIQRFGDGSVEHRSTRSFRYGGVIECRDGFVELLTLEDRQWQALVELMGRPDWATDEKLSDPLERSSRGDFLNDRIREWARGHEVGDLVARAQKLGVPMAPYNTPEQILSGSHEKERGLFQEIEIDGAGKLPVQTGPFRFGECPLPLHNGPPRPGADQALLQEGWAGEAKGMRRASA